MLGVMALSEQQRFQQMPSDASADRGERYALFADVSLAVALGAAVTGLVLYLADQRAFKQQLVANPRPGGVAWAARGLAWQW